MNILTANPLPVAKETKCTCGEEVYKYDLTECSEDSCCAEVCSECKVTCHVCGKAFCAECIDQNWHGSGESVCFSVKCESRMIEQLIAEGDRKEVTLDHYRNTLRTVMQYCESGEDNALIVGRVLGAIKIIFSS